MINIIMIITVSTINNKPIRVPNTATVAAGFTEPAQNAKQTDRDRQTNNSVMERERKRLAYKQTDAQGAFSAQA